MLNIATCLWFDREALPAAELYTSLFPNSAIGAVSYYDEAGPREPGLVRTVEFTLNGQPYLGLNGGPAFRFSEAISLMINCADQAEVDHYWNALSVDGGQPSNCGWLKDRYGLSWQVVPRGLMELTGDPDPQRARRAMSAMLTMHKIDIAEIRAAADRA